MPARSLPELARTAIASAFLPASRSRSVPRYTVSHPRLVTCSAVGQAPYAYPMAFARPLRLGWQSGMATRLGLSRAQVDVSPTGPSAVRVCAPGSTGERLQCDFALLAARVAIEPPRSSTSSRSRTAGMRAMVSRVGGRANGRGARGLSPHSRGVRPKYAARDARGSERGPHGRRLRGNRSMARSEPRIQPGAAVHLSILRLAARLIGRTTRFHRPTKLIRRGGGITTLNALKLTARLVRWLARLHGVPLGLSRGRCATGYLTAELVRRMSTFDGIVCVLHMGCNSA